MRTVDNVFVLNAVISHMLNNNKRLYVALVDFRKAYDLIDRDILWYKLIRYGIRGKVLNIIKSMYCSLKSTTVFASIHIQVDSRFSLHNTYMIQ